MTQLLKNGQTDVSVNYCLELIHSSKGQVRVEDLATKTGISTRQMVRRFDHCIGISPKEFTKIVKFINSLNFLRQKVNSNLAEAAHSCGYYDQAHFIRDFKEYTGLTPSQFLITENVFF